MGVVPLQEVLFAASYHVAFQNSAPLSQVLPGGGRHGRHAAPGRTGAGALPRQVAAAPPVHAGAGGAAGPTQSVVVSLRRGIEKVLIVKFQVDTPEAFPKLPKAGFIEGVWGFGGGPLLPRGSHEPPEFKFLTLCTEEN